MGTSLKYFSFFCAKSEWVKSSIMIKRGFRFIFSGLLKHISTNCLQILIQKVELVTFYFN
jgi:hypothetical protein